MKNKVIVQTVMILLSIVIGITLISSHPIIPAAPQDICLCQGPRDDTTRCTTTTGGCVLVGAETICSDETTGLTKKCAFDEGLTIGSCCECSMEDNPCDDPPPPAPEN